MGYRKRLMAERREMADLYAFGFQMKLICELYAVSPFTVRRYMHEFGLSRPTGRPKALYKRPNRGSKSSLQPIPEGGRYADADHPTPDQLLRSSVHALRDRRTAERPQDASTCSSRE
jgi:hypothetical protein